jgi:hypothetical protein
MSARKLGRLAGLVFVLAAVFGGIGVVDHATTHEAGASSSWNGAVDMRMLEGIWS